MRTLKLVGTIADKVKTSAYMVGSYVRDMIASRNRIGPIEIIVEGNADILVDAISKEVGSNVNTFLFCSFTSIY